MSAAPCVGKSVLFDSVTRLDHEAAKALCGTCPLLAACAENVPADARGTVAGELRGLTASEQRRFNEDGAFTNAEARRAHAAYVQGKQSTWARTGHRVYVRRVQAGVINPGGRKKDDAPCGTERGYQQHRYLGEPQDDACKAAHTAHNRAKAKAKTAALATKYDAVLRKVS